LKHDGILFLNHGAWSAWNARRAHTEEAILQPASLLPVSMSIFYHIFSKKDIGKINKNREFLSKNTRKAREKKFLANRG
jgi:hypothetical protein